MNISFACGQCGRKYTVGEHLAGKAVKCKECGQGLRIPSSPVPVPASGLDIYGLDDEPPRAPAPPPEELPDPIQPRAGKKPGKKSKARGLRARVEALEGWPGGKVVWLSAFGVSALMLAIIALTHVGGTLRLVTLAGLACFVGGGIWGVLATLRQGVLATLALFGGLTSLLGFLVSLTGRTGLNPLETGVSSAIGFAFFFARAKDLSLYRQPFTVSLSGMLVAIISSIAFVVTGQSTGPRPDDFASRPLVTSAPGRPGVTPAPPPPVRLPDPGPGREVEPGVVLHEVALPGGTRPGESGKLWLYLPAGDHGAKSLPCVLICGAGSNLLSGMTLGDGDRAEHLPYARAGFAVLAYELDGALRDRENITDAEVIRCGREFLAARAGLVNARVAIDFLRSKVPQVDPARLFTAGHSSAGSMALLLAANEPAIRGCVAYAPAVDLKARFGFVAVAQLRGAGLGDLATTYSPRDNESKIQCPVFLFHALDDSNVPPSESQSCAARLRKAGKRVTLETVPTGNHYDSMIRQGIPRGIAFLQGLAAETAANGSG